MVTSVNSCDLCVTWFDGYFRISNSCTTCYKGYFHKVTLFKVHRASHSKLLNIIN